MAELKKVVVAGGGVGGCAVALALRHAGIAVEVHEKYGGFQGRATGFSIWAYAIKRLLEFGFERERLDRIGREMVQQDIYSQGGEPMMSLPVAEVSETVGAPSMDRTAGASRRRSSTCWAMASTGSAPRWWASRATPTPRRRDSPTDPRPPATS
jgi:2-polyprenyl-6-methoxyphenol hydroxylase-like FAD-dependent oxidoreductase